MERIVVVLRSGIEILDRDEDGWNIRQTSPAPSLDCVAIHPDTPDRIFLGSFEEGVFRSTDGGDSFTAVNGTAMQSAVTSLTVDPTDPDTLVAGTEPSRLHRSADGGDTWTEIGGLTSVPSSSQWSFPPRPHTHHVRWIEVDPAEPDRWYVGIEAGALLVTPDGGETWIDRPEGSQYDNHTLATHPDAAGRVYSAAGDGYAESADGAESWYHPQEGLDHRYVWGLAVDPDDPATRLVSAAHGASGAHRLSSADSYVYRRVGDEPWKPLDDAGLPMGDGVLRAALSDGMAAGEFAAATNCGVYSTDDAGDNWQELTTGWVDRHGDAIVRGIVAL